mmetsp:Transcript_18175/g.55696  ORF Transcript_18175/g.55696 Transcript_18175/m.55696 type:complete len:320 (-) Transcript_18175:351-1310(-)
MLAQTLLHIAIYSAGTFYANPAKVLLNWAFGSRYAVAYAHFRRDHSVPLNVWLHALCTVIQVGGNFALLAAWDDALFPRERLLGLATATAAMWIFFLCATPSPSAVKVATSLVIGAGLLGRSVLARNFLLLALLQAPFEIACYWLIAPVHGFERPNRFRQFLMLAARLALWASLVPLRGALLPFVPGGAKTANLFAALLLAAGSLVRAEDNMPVCEHLGLAAWAPAILLDQPWLFFLCLSFVGQALQGVAHEITHQQGTLPQLNDARHELAHCAYFPILVLQTIHHSHCGPHPATVAALGDYPDPRSRKAMGLVANHQD